MLDIDLQGEKKKLKEINLTWGHGDDIRVFLSNIQKLQETLEDAYGIKWREDMRMTHLVAEFADSDIFTEEEMMEWEDNPEDEQT